MNIGVPKEIKADEYRVGLIPSSVKELIKAGHTVFVESNAGRGIGFTDQHYIESGAKILGTAKEIFEKSELIIKVKEPQPEECALLRENQTLFTYLHLAADEEQTNLLLQSGTTAIAYETVTAATGGLPLLTPMSVVAGRMSIQAGANALEKARGGKGLLLGGVPGVAPAHVVVLGGGVVGTNALRIAIGMEAHVTVLDKSLQRLTDLDFQFGPKLNTIFSTQDAIEEYVAQADLLIGAVLVPGAAAPKLVSKAMLKTMQPGSVIVDVAIDQGGCFETSRPTTHERPTYIVDDIVHYCVTNMPGAVPLTSTCALNNATLPFILALANQGVKKALKQDKHLLNGLNIHKGKLTYEAVAQAFEKNWMPPQEALTL